MPIISNSVEGPNIFLGARGMSSSVNRVRTWHKAVEQRERGGSKAMKKSSRLCRTPEMLSIEWMIHSKPPESELKR